MDESDRYTLLDIANRLEKAERMGIGSSDQPENNLYILVNDRQAKFMVEALKRIAVSNEI